MKAVLSLSVSAFLLFFLNVGTMENYSEVKHLSILKSFNSLWISSPEAVNSEKIEETRVYDLRCEHVKNPLAIDNELPLLSWKIESDINGIKPVGIEIQVATSTNKLNRGKTDLWKSGKITGTDLNQVLYRGKRLSPGQTAYWRVRAWMNDNSLTEWSPVASWSCGMPSSEWKGKWLGFSEDKIQPDTLYAPVWLFRKDFTIKKLEGKAVLYLAATGFAEAWINGRKADSSVLEPAVTDLRVRVPYRAYDVSHLLQKGNNTIGIRLGNGFMNHPTTHRYGMRYASYACSPRFMAKLSDMAEGSGKDICNSDETWLMTSSEITYNCVWGGEFIDMRLRNPDWCNPEPENLSGWTSPLILNAPAGKLSALTMPPCRVTEEFIPKSIKEVKPGIFVADMGVNFTGWTRFRGSGAKGKTVKVFISERLNPDGTIDKSAFGLIPESNPNHELRITFSGSGTEVLNPAFSFQSGRYVQIEGLDYQPKAEDITGCAVHNDFMEAGDFYCSSDLINQVHTQVKRVFRNNWIGMQFDCPHREKTAWLGDYTRTIQAMMYNFDMASCFTKAIQDILDNQRPGGGLGVIAPERRPWNTEIMDVWWQGDVWRMPWNHYLFSGDIRELELSYEPMKAFMNYFLGLRPDGFTPVGEVAPNGRTPAPPYGDHCSVGYFEERDTYVNDIHAGVAKEKAVKIFRTPHDLLGAIGTYDGAMTIARIASILGYAQDAEQFNALAEDIRRRIIGRMNPETGAFAKDSQTLQALALFYGIPDSTDREKVLNYLVHNIQITREGHLSTGTIGTRQLFRILSEEGEGALAVKMMHQPGYPGFVDMLEQGVTAIWERWDGKSSLNHPALGAIGDWFYANLAGIRPDPDFPGFRKIIFQPDIECGLLHARAEYNSGLGKIISEWKIDGNDITLRIKIPVGAEGRVILPGKYGFEPVNQEGVSRQTDEPGKTICMVGSGEYLFNGFFQKLKQ